MFKKIIVITLMLVTVFCLAACPGGSALPPVEEILEKTNQAMEGVISLSYDMDADLNVIATIEEEAGNVSAEISSSGVIDMESKQMRLEMDLVYGYTDVLSSSAESSLSMNMSMALYLLDEMAYIMIENPMAGVSWEKHEVPTEMIQQEEELMGESLDPAGMQELLIEISQVVLEGTENINGVDCYVLHITLDEYKLWQKIEQQAQGMGEEIPDGADVEALLEITRGISIKQWIAQDTYFVMGIQVVLDIELDAEDMGYTEEVDTVKIDASFNAFFYDYNQPVSIVLPEGAEDAIGALN